MQLNSHDIAAGGPQKVSFQHINCTLTAFPKIILLAKSVVNCQCHAYLST